MLKDKQEEEKETKKDSGNRIVIFLFYLASFRRRKVRKL